MGYHETTFGTFTAALFSKKCDLSVAGSYRTIPRAMSVSFTDPIIFLGQGAIVKKGETRFKAVEDFDKEGIKVAVIQGEGSHEFVKENFTNAELIVISATPDLSLAAAEVSAGRADVALIDAWTTKQYALAHPEVEDLFAEKPYDLTPIGWAVRKEDLELKDFLNTAIDYLDSTGKFEEFSEKYGSHWIRIKKVYDAE